MKHNISEIPETIFAIQNYLQAQIALAMLQHAGILNSQAVIYRVTSDAQETIPPAFSNPEEYLHRVLDVYHLIQEYPIPLVSSSCWQALTQGKKLNETIQKTISDNLHDPSSDIFWKFHNRTPLAFTISEEHRLLILSLFKEIHATF